MGGTLTRRAVSPGNNRFDMVCSYWSGRAEALCGAANTGVQQSLRLMKTGYLDLWQIHCFTCHADPAFNLELLRSCLARGPFTQPFESGR